MASQAPSPSQLTRFWVLHLGMVPERSSLPVELRACREFCLMKDVKKVCRELHGQQGCEQRRWALRSGQGNVTACQADCQKAREKLGDAVRELS